MESTSGVSISRYMSRKVDVLHQNHRLKKVQKLHGITVVMCVNMNIKIASHDQLPFRLVSKNSPNSVKKTFKVTGCLVRRLIHTYIHTLYFNSNLQSSSNNELISSSM
jgi:hypothetical protein